MRLQLLPDGKWLDLDKADEYEVYEDRFVRTRKGTFAYRLSDEKNYKCVTEEEFIKAIERTVKSYIEDSLDVMDETTTDHPLYLQINKAWKSVLSSDLEV